VLSFLVSPIRLAARAAVMSGQRLAAMDVQRLAAEEAAGQGNKTYRAMSSRVPIRRAGLRALSLAK
jgi:hypothetical protein